MAVLAKCGGGLGADPVRRRIGNDELRMAGFERLELAKQPVVLGVRHLRPVEHVIRVVRPLEQPPELGGARGRGGHCPRASSWITARATPTSRSSSSALA